MQHKDACPIFPSGRIESVDVVFPYGGLAHETFCLDALEPTRGNGKRVVESRKLKVFLREALFCMCWRLTKKIYCVYPLYSTNSNKLFFILAGGGGVLSRLEVEKNIFRSCVVVGFLPSNFDDAPWWWTLDFSIYMYLLTGTLQTSQMLIDMSCIWVDLGATGIRL